MERNNTLDLLINETKTTIGRKDFYCKRFSSKKERYWQEEPKPYNKIAANVSTCILWWINGDFIGQGIELRITMLPISRTKALFLKDIVRRTICNVQLRMIKNKAIIIIIIIYITAFFRKGIGIYM